MLWNGERRKNLDCHFTLRKNKTLHYFCLQSIKLKLGSHTIIIIKEFVALYNDFSFEVTISLEKIILQRKRALCYIRPHILYVGFTVGAKLRCRVGVRIR